ncbi:hypothetical protein ACFV42_40835 [Streptomyces solisilvae]|uniref:hypothetical protein n=1 Tax=Streptomyces malaysiensis TaxID=92644 RepID=UPI0036D0EFD4
MQWSRATGGYAPGIQLEPRDQEKLRALRDDLRGATGQGRDGMLPVLYTAAVALKLGCDGQGAWSPAAPDGVA